MVDGGFEIIQRLDEMNWLAALTNWATNWICSIAFVLGNLSTVGVTILMCAVVKCNADAV